MDEYDNIRQIPRKENAEAALPRFNLKNLSLFDEQGHLTVTFWLLCAAVVVMIYLFIEALSVEETQPVPTPDQNLSMNNHREASNPVKRTAKSEKPSESNA